MDQEDRAEKRKGGPGRGNTAKKLALNWQTQAKNSKNQQNKEKIYKTVELNFLQLI